jgi:hypothetical protein
MNNGGTAAAVETNERLARFILTRSHFRPDRTVKQDAFIPYPYPDLSVTRHLQLSEAALWQIGRDVARPTGKTLYGRADVEAAVFLRQELRVIADPIFPENPNHANVTGWPAEKPAQKIIAQRIAAAAGKALTPPPNTA